MARKGGRRPKSTRARAERRRRALNLAAADATTTPAPVAAQAGAETTQVGTAVAVEPSTTARLAPPQGGPDADSVRARGNGVVPWIVASAAALAVLAVLLATQLGDQPSEAAVRSPSPSIVVGALEGEIVTPEAMTSPSTSAEAAIAVPTAVGTPTLPPATLAPVPAPAATPGPTISTTPPPAPPSPATVPPGTTTPIVVAVLDEPDEAVAAFYRHVVNQEFDAAYALWSDRMKDQFPREENLDQRFADSEAIAFTQLRTVERSADRAVVQADFVEHYASGSSRTFIGYWELVVVDGRWLLDQPHY